MYVKTATPPPPPEEVGGDGFVFNNDESSPRSRSVSAKAKSTRPLLGRSKSMANLLSEVERQKKSFSLLTIVPDVQSSAIEEEHDEENPGANDALAPSDFRLDKSLYKGQQLLDVPPTNDLTKSANRRPSRRASLDSPLTSSLSRSFRLNRRTSQTSLTSSNLFVPPTNDLTKSANRRPSRRASLDGPLTSSLRRSFSLSLRTSQTSLTSSNLFDDRSQHSMKRNVSQAPSSTSGTDSSIVSGSGLERTEDDRAYIKSVLRQMYFSKMWSERDLKPIWHHHLTESNTKREM